MDARVSSIISEMTDYGVYFDELGGVLESARMREEMLGIDKSSGLYRSMETRVRDLDKVIESVDRNSRIHETIDTYGSKTGRMSHSEPNLAGISSDYKIRKLFKAPSGFSMVGVDAKALELRMLAHYMNDDEYTKEIVDGDIHATNQVVTGLKSRNTAKSFIFALIYGAGDKRIGEIIGRTPKEAGLIKRNYYDNNPAFKDLRDKVIRVSAKGWIKGLDGKKIEVEAEYKALNTLLQSAGAVVMKRALIILYDDAMEAGIDFHFVLNIHDEFQTEVAEGQEEEFGKMAVNAIVKAGEYYDLNCPLDAEYYIGENWGLTH